MNLETKITIYKFTPQLFTLTQEKVYFNSFLPPYLYDFLTLILSLSTLLLPMFSGKVRFLPYICSKNV